MSIARRNRELLFFTSSLIPILQFYTIINCRNGLYLFHKHDKSLVMLLDFIKQHRLLSTRRKPAAAPTLILMLGWTSDGTKHHIANKTDLYVNLQAQSPHDTLQSADLASTESQYYPPSPLMLPCNNVNVRVASTQITKSKQIEPSRY